MNKFIFFCSLLVALSLVYTKIYLPCLPSIAISLGIYGALVQFGLIINIIGFGLSQLFYGPLSDCFGRKKILCIGLCIATIGNIISAYSSNAYGLCFGQFTVGMGAGACSIIPRAIAKDVFEGLSLIKIIAYMSAASTAAGFSPAIGGLLLNYVGWRGVFLFLAMISLLAAGFLIFFIKETKPNSINGKNFFTVLREYILLFTHVKFLQYASMSSVIYAGIILYLIMLPFYLQNQFNYSVNENSMIFLLCAMSYLLGNALTTKLTQSYSDIKVVFSGIVIFSIGSLILPVSDKFHVLQTGCLIISGILINFGAGIVTPITYKNILNIESIPSGVIAAGVGFVRVAAAFLVTVCASRFLDQNPIKLGVILTLLSLITFTIYCSLRKKNLSYMERI